jgi:hypothetical protein
MAGDFVRRFGINFPLYSVRYRNMIKDFYVPSNISIHLFGYYNNSYENNVKETVKWLEKEGSYYFPYWEQFF